MEPYSLIVLCLIWDTRFEWGSYPSAEMQLVYSTAPDDWITRWGTFYPSGEIQLVYSTDLDFHLDR